MVVIDMKEPDCCDNCPCSYWIQTGEHAGRLMCSVMEANQKKNCLVEERGRPGECPILTEIRRSDFERWLEMMAEIRLDLN